MATTTDPARLAMLARVERGELDHSAAAKELGLTPGVWGLWRARQAKAAGGGKAVVATKPARKNARGRMADPAETARRVTMLERVQAGELNNAAAARKLGITAGAWGVWKSGHLKRTDAKKSARRGRPPGSAHRGRPPGKATTSASAQIAGVAGVVAQLEGLQSFGQELRERVRVRVRTMLKMAERRFPG